MAFILYMQNIGVIRQVVWTFFAAVTEVLLMIIIKEKVLPVLLVIMMLFLYPTQVFAENDTCVISMEVEFGQTEARAMLKQINEFRLSGSAWQYDENNRKVAVTGLKKLTYDYELEDTAMLRAVEIAVSFSHTRPSGEPWYTAYSAYQAAGENIAVGYTSAEEVFEGWKEENEPYSGQGHRRNMLDSTFAAVGIGHVIYNGIHYWVQEFRNPNLGTDATEAADGTYIAPIEIRSEDISSMILSSQADSISLGKGESTKLPGVNAIIRLASGKIIEAVDPTVSWSIADSSVAKLGKNTITGLRKGNTSLTGKVTIGNLTEETQVSVEVTEKTEDWILGDVNKDKAVDAKDLTALGRHLAKIEIISDEVALNAADTNRDGGITAVDLTQLAKYVAKIIQEL